MTRRTAIEAITAADTLPGIRAFYAGNAFVAPSARKHLPGTYLGDDLIEAAQIIESTTP